MSTDELRPGGLIVIRLWREAGDEVRIRMTSSTDLRPESVRTRVVTSRDEVLRLVEGWLDEVLGPVTRS
ncbi:hypothetical protein OHA18_38190 [Kribbella sp. NBC_00709]|uniref:hypothetical protein n=1 Tax=Kribbella sp. NBC_00709 TaxID=2975972 RepID=UPI002E27D15E|nr:hypothetical protein [Kribbella sp. NBC_00709]